jgi:hypothetical protein
MNRVARWIARLYPPVWRERYGDEFAALLEESGVTWRTAIDVAESALMMRVRSSSFWIIAPCLSALGAVGGIMVASELENRPLPVEIKSLDRANWPPVHDSFARCAAVVGADNCGFKSSMPARTFSSFMAIENGKIVVNYLRGDVEAERQARALASQHWRIDQTTRMFGQAKEPHRLAYAICGLASGLLVCLAIVVIGHRRKMA